MAKEEDTRSGGYNQDLSRAAAGGARGRGKGRRDGRKKKKGVEGRSRDTSWKGGEILKKKNSPRGAADAITPRRTTRAEAVRRGAKLAVRDTGIAAAEVMAAMMLERTCVWEEGRGRQGERGSRERWGMRYLEQRDISPPPTRLEASFCVCNTTRSLIWFFFGSRTHTRSRRIGTRREKRRGKIRQRVSMEENMGVSGITHTRTVCIRCAPQRRQRRRLIFL